MVPKFTVLSASAQPRATNGRRAIRFNDDTREWEFWSVVGQAWYFLAGADYQEETVRSIAGRSVYGCAPIDVLVRSYRFTKNDPRVAAGGP